MIRKKGKQGPAQEKRKAEESERLSSGRIDPATERKLIEVSGFTRRQLYNRRGALWEKGLAAVLDSTDTVVGATEQGALIKTREGTQQTFYNLDRPQPFLAPIAPATPKGSGSSEP